MSTDIAGVDDANNLYRYGLANPVRFTDPSGLDAAGGAFLEELIHQILGLVGAGTKQDFQFCVPLPVNPALSLCVIVSIEITARGCCRDRQRLVCVVIRLQVDGGLYATVSMTGAGFINTNTRQAFKRASPSLKRWKRPISGAPKLLQAGRCPPEGWSGQICGTISAGISTWTYGARVCAHYSFQTKDWTIVPTAGWGIGNGTGASIGGGVTYTECFVD
jgi:hypothetical protein